MRNMSTNYIIDYNQGVDPICALISVTFAVYKSCEQYDILLDFEVLQRELEHWAVKKYRKAFISQFYIPIYFLYVYLSEISRIETFADFYHIKLSKRSKQT